VSKRDRKVPSKPPIYIMHHCMSSLLASHHIYMLTDLLQWRSTTSLTTKITIVKLSQLGCHIYKRIRERKKKLYIYIYQICQRSLLSNDHFFPSLLPLEIIFQWLSIRDIYCYCIIGRWSYKQMKRNGRSQVLGSGEKPKRKWSRKC
jgi:hypothetical protein